MLVVYSCLLHFKDDVSVYLPFTQITVLLFITQVCISISLIMIHLRVILRIRFVVLIFLNEKEAY